MINIKISRLSEVHGGSACQKICLPKQETQVLSPGQEDPLEKEMATTPVLLPGKSHGQTGLAGYSSWSHKQSDMI